MKKAYFYSEGLGMFATGCKTPEEAIAIMRKEYTSGNESEESVGFSLEQIKADELKIDTAYYDFGEETMSCIRCGKERE